MTNQKLPTTQSSGRPSPYDYSDYREFLDAYCRYKKSVNPKFSIRQFSRKAQVGSQCYLTTIIKGHRNLSPLTIGRFARAMGLDQFDQFRKEDLDYYKSTLPTLRITKEAINETKYSAHPNTIQSQRNLSH